MAKITDIKNYPRPPRKRRQGRDAGIELDLPPDINCNMSWDDPPSAELDKDPEELLDGDRIPAIVVKGCFALYHLVREHKRRRTRVPKYLLAFARTYEEPLIPAAETVYEDFFGGGCDPGEIPEHLMDVGLDTAYNVDVCVRHALRLHYLLEVCTRTDSAAPRDALSGIMPRGFALHLLLGLLLAEYQRWAATAGELKSM